MLKNRMVDQPYGTYSVYSALKTGLCVTCPRCGGTVAEHSKGFFCENRNCRFAMWKDSRFFSAKRKTLTKPIAAVLLREGRVRLTGCFSEKTGKTYDATVVLEDDGTKTNYKLVFGNG